MLILLNGTLITPLPHQSFLICIRLYKVVAPFLSFCFYTLMSFCLCHSALLPFTSLQPTFHYLSLSLDPSSNIPHLCNSYFASFSSSFPSALPSLLFLFEMWLSWDEKLIFVSPPLTLSSHSVHHPVYVTAFLPSALSALLNKSRERHSQELFKQNANGLLMDPRFP